MNELLIAKFKDIQASTPRVIFGYRYVVNKKLSEAYVPITNLRLEVLQVGGGKVKHTLAVPLLDVRFGKSNIIFADKKVVYVSDGPRANIIIRSWFAKDDEQVTVVPHCGTVTVTEDSKPELLERVCRLWKAPAYPGLDMRVPDMYRCTKNPDRLRLNVTRDLRSALGLKTGVAPEDLKELFMANIESLTVQTDKGYVIPMEWVYAGGMIVADGSTVAKQFPAVCYIRSTEFFKNWCTAHKWDIEGIDDTDDTERASE